MFSNLGLHVIDFPTGRYGFVGTIPAILGQPVRANTADIMGGRSVIGPDGESYVLKFPTFDTEGEALEYAASFGFTAKTPVRD